MLGQAAADCCDLDAQAYACAAAPIFPSLTDGRQPPPSPRRWHWIKKLSLENGADSDVITEGLPWQMHRRAANASSPYPILPEIAAGVPFPVNLANFVALTVRSGAAAGCARVG